MIEPKGEPWPPLTQAKLKARDGPHCAHCGTTDDLTIQHRAVRGSGGRNSAEAPSNGLLLCWAANTLLESDAAFAEHGRAMGWKLSTSAKTSEVPFYDAWMGVWKQPDDDWNAPTVG